MHPANIFICCDSLRESKAYLSLQSYVLKVSIALFTFV